jgi:hypothetical protein
MLLQKVVSTTVEAVGYDNTNQTLHILFKDKTYYKYFDVPFSYYNIILYAPSKGLIANKISKMFKSEKQ